MAIAKRIRSWFGVPVERPPESAHPDDSARLRAERVLNPLRWVAIVSWIVILVVSPESPTGATGVLLGALVLYTAITSLWVHGKRAPQPLPFVTSFTDLGFVAALCALTGGLDSVGFPFLYLAILSTAVRFGFRGGFVAAASVAMVAVGLNLWVSSDASILDLGLRTFYAFLFALLGGLLAREHARRQAHLTRERDDAELLIRAHRAIASTLDPQQLLERALESIDRAAPCRGSLLAVFDENRQSIARGAIRGCLRLPGDPDSIDWLRSAPTLRVDQSSPEVVSSEIPSFLREHDPHSMISIPLQRQSTTGVLVVLDRISEERPLPFSDREFNLVTTIAHEATVALDDAELFEKMRASQVLERDLLRRLIRSQEDERKRLVGEIHDELGGRIVAALHRVRQVQANVSLAEGDRSRLRDVENQIALTAEKIRNLMEQLRPSTLDELGLRDAVQSHIDEVRREAPFELKLDLPNELSAVGQSAGLALFRILQEALRNALHHARGAQSVGVRLTSDVKNLWLEITDDGCGFDPERPNAKHFGLFYMRERAEACGGSFSIKGTPDGVTVRARIPRVDLDA